MRTIQTISMLVLLTSFVIVGCEQSVDPLTSGEPSGDGNVIIDLPPEIESDKEVADRIPDMSACHQPAPGPLVSVAFGSMTKVLWPYTGANFSGTPQDPVNLIFVGKADPRDIRAALMSLDGDRSGTPFPPVPPFTSTWEDAIGDVQTGYAEPEGWTGGVVQLACGDYQQARFHMRMFKFGDWTLANAHFEVLIPGTTEHQVLSWELAEQFVVADLMRSGLLDAVVPVMPTGPINDSPFRTIPAIIYNGLPVELRMLIGGPLGDVGADVPIATDGQAMVLNLAASVPRETNTWHQSMTINYDQVVPKPFCSAGPEDYVYVQGPVEMHQTVSLTASGQFTMDFKAVGALTVVPVNPVTGEPVGEPMSAKVLETHKGLLTDRIATNGSVVFQRLLPRSNPHAGWIFKRLNVATRGWNAYQELGQCSAED